MQNDWKNYSKIFPNILNKRERAEKADKILKIITDYYSNKQILKDKIVLDIGCSNAIISNNLSSYFKEIFGTDIDLSALQSASTHINTNLCLINSDTIKLPFKNNSMDIVICNHIYQYFETPQELINEIYRVLKKNGICYFAAANRYALFFKNYPFTGFIWWLNPSIKKYINKFIKKKYFSEDFLNRQELLNLFQNFSAVEYTIKILKNPDFFSESRFYYFYLFISKIPELILQKLIFFSFTFIWILKKD